MREIKFRAWDKTIKSFIPWEYFKSFNLSIFEKCESYNGLEKHEYELQQYTGLKDKNGKEIYEGDIIKTKKNIYKIVWNQECARWGLKNLDKYPVSIHHNGKYLEVIGNIYENSNLLK